MSVPVQTQPATATTATTAIPVTTALPRKASVTVTVRPEVIKAFRSRAHGDAEARARANAINTWEEQYGEPVPWHEGVSACAHHTEQSCTYEITVETQ